jgi:hypothetical protein
MEIGAQGMTSDETRGPCGSSRDARSYHGDDRLNGCNQQPRADFAVSETAEALLDGQSIETRAMKLVRASGEIR